ncbi:MAG: AAA family ATPase [Roseitalea sp.]|nr:AAA family ATPase [Roseitalea sp.]MBO6591004.1 AAA family ATPase [Roseitalea sp.]MBO6599738.1 AAA family ATPase [Roseitalea sp.]MBO6611494.1 AAA family ATPase [Roseitalea sp.]MBO6670577.1 AAA family ATPase [Roseitalea sp.]
MNALIDIMPVEPAFVMTKTAQRIMQGLQYAQAAPEMVTISTGAGCGKSSVCRHFRDTSPHAYLVTMRPRTKSTHNMLSEIAHELKIKKGAVDMLDRNIGEKLRRNGQKPILIIDEAQNLTNEAIDQLRYLLDVYECGIALVGNDEIYTRFAQKNGPSFAQLRRRIGMRINITRVAPEDIEAMIAAWRVEDEDIAGLLRAIGNKPGALGHITKTMQLAGMIANGEGRPLTARDVQQAWSNRGAEG